MREAHTPPRFRRAMRPSVGMRPPCVACGHVKRCSAYLPTAMLPSMHLADSFESGASNKTPALTPHLHTARVSQRRTVLGLRQSSSTSGGPAGCGAFFVARFATSAHSTLIEIGILEEKRLTWPEDPHTARVSQRRTVLGLRQSSSTSGRPAGCGAFFVARFATSSHRMGGYDVLQRACDDWLFRQTRYDVHFEVVYSII